MNTMKSAMAKIAEVNKSNVELASERVELGLVEDIAAATTKARQIAADLNGAVNMADKTQIELNKLQAEYDKQVANVKKLYPVASKFQDSEDKIWEKAKAAADNLGLKREDIKGWKDFADTGLSVNSAINGANKYMS